MLRCGNIEGRCTPEPLPPIPQEPKLNAGLKELHDLVQIVREECLASSKRQEMVLARLLEQQQSLKDQVISVQAPESRENQQSSAEPPQQPTSEEIKEQEAGDAENVIKEDLECEGRGSSDVATGEEKKKTEEAAAPKEVKVVDTSCRGRCRRFVTSHTFDGVMGVLIILNVVMMFVELEKGAYYAAVKLGLKEDSNFWNKKNRDVLEGFEHFFNCVFLLEILLRFTCDTWDTIHSIACWFDTFIVMTSGMDYLFKFVLSGSGANVNFLRMARLIKLVKLFRAFKAAAAFSELRILIKTLVTSMMALTWSAVLLSFIMLFGSLVMAQLLAGFIVDEQNDYELRKWVFERYGSGSRSFYTLFEATLSGGWPNYSRDLIEGVSTWYAVFWMLYVSVVVFAVMRVVGALFLQNTLKMASADEELMHLDKMKRKEAYIAKLKAFLLTTDKDGNGHMDKQELEVVLARSDISAWLDAIGLECHEVMGLFHVLDDGHGEITHEELLGGMMKLSGGVRAIDSVLMQRDMKRVLRWVMQIAKQVGAPLRD